VTFLSFRLQGCACRARRSRAVARYRPSGRCAAQIRSCLCACLLGIDRFHTCACRACRWEEKKEQEQCGFHARWSPRPASSASLRASHVPPLAFRFAHLLASFDVIARASFTIAASPALFGSSPRGPVRVNTGATRRCIRTMRRWNGVCSVRALFSCSGTVRVEMRAGWLVRQGMRMNRGARRDLRGL